MTQFIPVVDLDTGIIIDASAETLTFDVPVDLEGRARHAFLDRVGLLHYSGTDGVGHVCAARSTSLSERLPEETCFVSGSEQDRDGDGWLLFRLCMLES